MEFLFAAFILTSLAGVYMAWDAGKRHGYEMGQRKFVEKFANMNRERRRQMMREMVREFKDDDRKPR